MLKKMTKKELVNSLSAYSDDLIVTVVASREDVELQGIDIGCNQKGDLLMIIVGEEYTGEALG